MTDKPKNNRKKPAKRRGRKKRAFRWSTVLIPLTLVMVLAIALHWSYLMVHVRYFFWAAPADVPAASQTESDTAASRPILVTPDTLWIPKLDLEAPIVYVTERNEPAYQAALKRGVGHFPGTAIPGRVGNVYIFGHSSDYSWADGDYKTVFALLPQLDIGDRITASDRQGRAFDYVVTETKVVAPKDLSVLQAPDSQKRMLTLQTSYPLGTALRRYLVIAELASDKQQESD
jgi:sortase A